MPGTKRSQLSAGLITGLLALSALLSACGSAKFGDPPPGGPGAGTPPPPPEPTVPGPEPGSVARQCSEGSTPIVNALGSTATTLGDTDAITISLGGLPAAAPIKLSITDPNGDELAPPGGFVAVSDEEGCLANHTILPTGAAGLPVPGTYTLTVRDQADAEIRTLTFPIANSSRVLCTRSDGTPATSFRPGESVSARVEKAGGTLADGAYNVHVVPDVNLAPFEGQPLGAALGRVTVTGGTGTLDLGAFIPGQYDIVVDLNNDGLFQAADIMSKPHRFNACFLVQDAPGPAPIVGQIATDRNGNARAIFDPGATAHADIRDVHAQFRPPVQSGSTTIAAAKKYVVQHRAEWMGGEPLADVTGLPVKTDPTQPESFAESIWMVWPRSKLQPGCYDMVVDVNGNDIYDSGTDFLDNTDSDGNTSCGFRVADPACADDISITGPANDSVTESTVATLSGTVAGAVVSGSATLTTGSQSNTVNLTVNNGAFTARLPLFRGHNLITAAFVLADGRACAKTIRVGSAIPGNDLFRVQLTWDGSTDMDLHLVRPTGTYENGGGGTNDCNFANCTVGEQGLGNNDIDWGEIGREQDDAKLDVDCISCGNGVENIFMQEIGDDGRYAVFVDAFSGSETEVDVTIFIRGAQVGRVRCGAMSSGGPTDSCFVGTIEWTGGNNGTGVFRPVNVKAGDFVTPSFTPVP